MESIIINFEEIEKMGTIEQFIEECKLEKINEDLLTAWKELVDFTPIEVAV